MPQAVHRMLYGSKISPHALFFLKREILPTPADGTEPENTGQPEDEKAYLEKLVDSLKRELKTIRDRIAELSRNKKG